jgi:hypothetical protein
MSIAIVVTNEFLTTWIGYTGFIAIGNSLAEAQLAMVAALVHQK